MITKRSGIENHSCVDFLIGEVSKLKQENLQFTYLMKIKDETIAVFKQENDYLREQLEKEEKKNPDLIAGPDPYGDELEAYGLEDPDPDSDSESYPQPDQDGY